MATIEEVERAARDWAAQQNRLQAEKRRANRINYTERAAEHIAAGVHPVRGLKLAGTDETCGTCGLAVQVGHGAREYWKCGDLDGRFVTRSEASDIRLKWPACTAWQPSRDSGPGVTLSDLGISGTD